MNEWINDELLSAYLDGEVTAEEQAKIEKLLASQPQARQLLDELRALSGALQSLPPARLETDLSDRVIRAAQRQILTGGEAATDSTGAAGSLWTQLRKRLTGRALFWPAVAAALALWIVLTDLGRVGVAPHQREIVNAPAMSALENKKPADGDSAVGAMGSNRVAAKSVGVDAASVGARGDAASSEMTSTSEAGAAVPAPKPGMIGPMASGDEAVARKTNDESERLSVGSAAAEPRNGAADPGEPMVYGDSHAPQRPAERRSMALGGAGVGPGGVGAAVPPPAAMAAAPRPAADALRTDGAATTAAREPENGRRSGIASVDALMEETSADSGAAEEGILVVHVDIAADAARNDVFGQLLAQNYILWEPDPALAGASGWNSLNPLWRATDAGASAGRSDAPPARDKAAPALADSDADGRGAADQKTKENQMAFREPLQPGGLRGAADPSDQGAVPRGNGDSRGSVARAMKGTAAALPAAPAAIEPQAGNLPAAGPAAERPSLAKSEGQAFGGVPEGAALRALKAPPSPEIELVYVEAQASQIQNLIADLTDAHQSVVSVAVEPARGTQNFSTQQRGRPVGQLAQTRALPSPPPGEAISGSGQKRLMAGGLPAQPEEGRAIRSPDMPAEHLPKSAPGVEGPLSGAGAASRQLAGEYNAATAENERLEEKADRAEREQPESKLQADRIRQFGRAAEQGASNEGPAGGQVVLGRAHRVARLDAQNQVAGQTWKDQMAAAPAQGGKAVVEPAEGGSASAKPDAADAPLHDGSRQALVRREAGQPLGAAPDAVELVEKAKQGDDGAGRDSSLVRPGSQTVLPHAARQQRVLFVLRTVPAVQAAAARPQGFAPAAAPADAVASPDAERAAPPGEANGGETRDNPSHNPAPQ